MSSVSLAAGASLTVPPGSVEVSDDGERLRVVWHPTRGETRRALFAVPDGGDVAILQHVREVRLRQRGPTTSSLDERAELADVPEHLLSVLRDAGLTPLERDRHAEF